MKQFLAGAFLALLCSTALLPLVAQTSSPPAQLAEKPAAKEYITLVVQATKERPAYIMSVYPDGSRLGGQADDLAGVRMSKYADPADINMRGLNKKLNQLGAEGWQVETSNTVVIYTDVVNGFTSNFNKTTDYQTTYILSRPVQQ